MVILQNVLKTMYCKLVSQIRISNLKLFFVEVPDEDMFEKIGKLVKINLCFIQGHFFVST